MTLAPLSFNCPKCGSSDVVYSCTPSCCFNHVCSQCYATFEPVTTRVGEYDGEFGLLPEVDSAGPTAPCARCGECRLFAITDEASDRHLLCVSCRAVLSFELKESE